MNTTFTTCATKAKQILNLLQGYTKGIRITAVLILLLMGVSNAWAWWFVPGSWNGWDSKEASSGGVAQMNGSNTITFYNVPKGSYEMKLIKGTEWGNGNYTNKSTGYISSVSKGGGNDKITLSKACDLTFTITNEGTWNCDVSASDPSYYIKYNWNGSGWAWSGSLTSSNSYSCTGQYGGSGSFDHTRVSSTDVDGTNATATLVNSPSKGDLCVFTYNTSNKSLTITRCNKVTANSKIYFDNSLTNWSNSNIYFVVGHDKPTAYSKVYKMNAVNNTKLFYAEISETWEDATYYAIVGVDNEWSNGNWGSSNLTSATKYTAAYTAKYDLGTNGCYYITPSTGNNNTAFTITYKEGYNNIPKITATQSAKIRNSITDQQYTTATGTWPATLKLEGTHLTGFGNDKSARSTISSTTSGSNVNYEAVVTGLITHSYSNLSDDYQFDGWIKGSGTSLTSTNSTYSYNITAATTVYACFTKKHAITFGVYSSGGGSISAKADGNSITSGTKVVGGSEIIFTASPSAGYRIQGWYSDANCTSKIAEAEESYTITSLTEAKTIYVKYEEIPEDKFPVTIQTNNANYGTVYPSGLQQVGKSGINITATAKTGYQFDEWTCTGYASVEDASNPNTIASATAAGTVTANFSIKNFTITYHLNGGTNNTSNPASYTVETETITLQDPTKEGFLFAGWYTTSTFSGTAVTSITKGSIGDKTLYAKWLNSSDCIFFYNNLGWSNVYVYFYNNADGHNYWADDYGTGANAQQKFWENNPYFEMEHGTMTQIKGTNIWYYYATYIKTNQRSKVSFANVNQSCDKEANNTNSYFQNAQVVYRADLDYEKRLPMFVPHTTQSHYFSNTKSTYYNHGYWMNYPTNTGYKLHIFDENGNKINDQLVEIPFEYGDNMIMPWSVNVSLEGATTYAFKIQRADDVWYGNNGTMTTKSSGDVGQTAWEFTTGTNNCKITTTAPGTYVFTLKYDKDRNSNYNYLVGVEYPASVGDYRLAYKDNAHPFHPEHLLKKRDGKDTVSFFVHHDQDLSPVIMLQEVTEIDAQTGAITWETISTTEINGISATGIYNFILEQSGNAATLLNTITEYTGDFYIRTDATAGGWGNFRQKSNQMTYSSYADNHSNFNHYFVEWIHQGKNVKFTIANDYSYCLSDTLDADDIVTTGNLPADANVRFGWDSHTNKLSRAYIAGTENEQYRFLVLGGIDDNLKDKDGNTLTNNEIVFTDLEDWIYQADVTTNENTMIRLTAQYNDQTQYFKGAADGENQYIPVLTGGASGNYKIRFIYNFKSNHLVTAWLADGNNITEDKVLGTDLMVIRQNQDAAAQLKLNSNETKLSEVGTIYATMTFTKDHLESTTASEWERLYYWISFPFDVRISDVFGFGEYGKQWIIEYYDGAARAKNGYWLESDTYWKYISDTTYVAGKSNEDANGNPNNGVLVANKGYVLALARSIANQGLFKNGNEYVRLYFPSMNKIGSIDGDMQNVVTLLQEYPCTITGREAYDNNWHMIGVPSYADKNHTLTQDELIYYYEYQAKDNTYQVTTTTAQLRDPDISSSEAKSVTFKSMHSYMVQYAGTINWRNWATTPQQLAARRNTHSEQDTYSLRLELQRNGTYADQTFVQLKDESTTDYDMNIDLTKLMNSGTNIYTLAGEQRIQLAGSVIPVAETTIPVGVKVAAAGEYTLAMPDGTDGITALLIDYETNTTTDLLLSDYTVTLPKGSTENRFALIVKPRKTATRMENIGEGAKDADKYIIDGALYLQRDGKLYNAQGQIMR